MREGRRRKGRESGKVKKIERGVSVGRQTKSINKRNIEKVKREREREGG